MAPQFCYGNSLESVTLLRSLEDSGVLITLPEILQTLTEEQLMTDFEICNQAGICIFHSEHTLTPQISLYGCNEMYSIVRELIILEFKRRDIEVN